MSATSNATVYPRHLNTPTIKVYVGFGSDLKIYWGLLEGRLLPTVGKHYSEEYVKHRCRFPEETTQIFDIYAQFIYGADLPRDLDTLTLLKLYGFGLRSFTKELRHATVDRMITALGLGRDDPNYLGNEEVCDLLLIMPHEIPEPDENQDPMADLIFWYAARRLTTLKKMTTFNHLIHDYPEISCGILMKACDADYHLPGV